VDPWAPVDTAVLTHAHADHAVPGCRRYLCAEPGAPLARRRLGPEAAVEGLPYGQPVRLGETVVSLHPAGHVLGSAQVRIEASSEVWVISGDYKRAADPTCAPFEVVACDTFLTEATFALPVFRWDETRGVVAEIVDWWEANRRRGRASVLFCYVLGKAQRILAELAPLVERPVFIHGAFEAPVEIYRAAGVRMLETRRVASVAKRGSFAGELVLAPPLARGSTWMRRFGDHETGFASGWMRLRGPRRRQGFDRGFVLSDHADWPALLRTVQETGARRVLATHGYAEDLARYLREQGLDAGALATRYEGESED
jgi:putative mRNA 3-end processing factor